MGQNLARRQKSKGDRLYQQQRTEEAICYWSRSLQKQQDPFVKFQVSGLLCMAKCEIGKWREAMDYAGLQYDLVTYLTDAADHRAQVYLNMALCNLHAAVYSKTIYYCRLALQTQSEKRPLTGTIHLLLGKAFLWQTELQRAHLHLTRALTHARKFNDLILELETQVALSHIYSNLNDHENALSCCNTTLQLVHSLSTKQTFSPEVAAAVVRFRRRLATVLSRPYCKLTRYNEALENCEDAMEIACAYGDRLVQAECLFSFAEILRKRCDVERARPRYESALSIMTEISNQLGQVRVLAGLAKIAANTGDRKKAIDINERALCMSQKIGCKMEMLRCHARLHTLYIEIGDVIRSHRHENVFQQLCDEMELFCGVCGDVLGRTMELVKPLQCSHFIHDRCVQHLTRSTLGRTCKIRPCPACRRKAFLHPMNTCSFDIATLT